MANGAGTKSVEILRLAQDRNGFRSMVTNASSDMFEERRDVAVSFKINSLFAHLENTMFSALYEESSR